MSYKEKLKELGIELDRTGRQRCPQCSDKRKNYSEKCLSVTYTDDAVLYNCHNCGWAGAVRYKDDRKKMFTKPAPLKETNMPLGLLSYLSSRHISGSTALKYHLSMNSNGELQFPYYKNGELVNVKYRTNLPDGKKKFRQEKDAEKTLFGMDKVDKNKPLVFVEGEFDVLSFAEQDIYTVSVPQGGNDKELECLENCYDFIAKFKSYIIAVDNDEVGNNLKNNLLNRLGKENCTVVNWGRFKDANEALVAGESLKDYLYNAKPVCPEGVITYVDEYDNIFKSVFEEDSEYFLTGWRDLDKIIKIRLGYLMVVTGYPSRGKSTFVNNLLVNLTKRYGFKHLIASFETTAASSYIELLEMFKQAPIDIIKRNKEQVFDSFSEISDHFLRLDTGRQWTVDEIIKKTEYMVKKYGINTLVIDPYNRLKNDYRDREDKYVGSILSKLCMLSKKLNILVIFVAHPKKPDDEEMPNMYSISGSGDWYNMADYGIIVHRDRNETTQELENKPKICVGKVKNFALGKTSGGVVTLNYNVNRRILTDC